MGAIGFVATSVAAVVFLVGEVLSIGVFLILSIVIAFGGGFALLLTGKTWARGLGFGLMIGWALVVLFTAGLCVAVLQSY
ncbi:hypothetical protein [Nocardia sp. XZ_19_385]|uniref:hypothetical protein n=1 Tax=Nocardia sp. XZ_19_385 TaxID=2769488 RepID=UPI00188EF03F|nr:hypothetical protein [Nocardia sp. XZ_19_385]